MAWIDLKTGESSAAIGEGKVQADISPEFLKKCFVITQLPKAMCKVEWPYLGASSSEFLDKFKDIAGWSGKNSSEMYFRISEKAWFMTNKRAESVFDWIISCFKVWGFPAIYADGKLFVSQSASTSGFAAQTSTTPDWKMGVNSGINTDKPSSKKEAFSKKDSICGDAANNMWSIIEGEAIQEPPPQAKGGYSADSISYDKWKDIQAKFSDEKKAAAWKATKESNSTVNMGGGSGTKQNKAGKKASGKQKKASFDDFGVLETTPEMNFCQAIFGGGKVSVELKVKLVKGIYRVAAQYLHPDKTGGDKGLSSHFADMSVAYKALLSALEKEKK
jgi:hypothetical protein